MRWHLSAIRSVGGMQPESPTTTSIPFPGRSKTAARRSHDRVCRILCARHRRLPLLCGQGRCGARPRWYRAETKGAGECLLFAPISVTQPVRFAGLFEENLDRHV